MKREETVIALLLEVGREKLLDFLPPESSVGATRIAIDVLSHFSIMSVPVSVKVEITGPQGIKMKIGSKKNHPHLVAYLPGRRQILDLTLDQASAPQAEITFTPSAFPVHPHFVSNPKYQETFMVPQPNGWAAVLVIYESVLDHSFERNPEWHRQMAKGKENAFSKITTSLVNEISKRLGD